MAAMASLRNISSSSQYSACDARARARSRGGSVRAQEDRVSEEQTGVEAPPGKTPGNTRPASKLALTFTL
jgi:hypothetical protein